MGAIKEIAALTAKNLVTTPKLAEYYNPFDWKGGGAKYYTDKLQKEVKPYLETGLSLKAATDAVASLQKTKLGKDAVTLTMQLLTPLNAEKSAKAVDVAISGASKVKDVVKVGNTGIKKVLGLAKDVGKDAIAHPVYATGFVVAGEVAQAVGDYYENNKKATRVIRGAGAATVAAGITAALLGSVSLGVGIGFIGYKAIKGSLKG